MSELLYQQPVFPPVKGSGAYCEPDAHGRCLTCSDDAQPAAVLQLHDDGWTAVVEMDGRETEIDVSLLDEVAVGEVVLVHGGVALERVRD